MIFEEKTIILKDGRTAILKSPCVEDAEKLLNYIKKSCSETDFLARYPEEWTTTIGQEEAWVNRLRSAPDTLGITCYVDGEDAGNCEISFRGDMKVSHRATIANAILKDYWNLGIGSAMFEELVSAAQNRGTEIMELEFIEGNDRARAMTVQDTCTKNSDSVLFAKDRICLSSRTALTEVSSICRNTYDKRQDCQLRQPCLEYYLLLKANHLTP